MSTDTNTATVEALLKRNSELEAAVAKANADAKKRRHELRSEQEAHNKLKGEHEALTARVQKAEASPGEWKTKAEKLQAELHARDAKDAWKEAIGDSLRDKVTIEKLWKELEYTPGEAVPTPEEISEQLKAARESVPYLFKDADATSATDPRGSTMPATKPPLKETVDGGRGAPVKTANRVTVRKSQLQDPEWKLDKRNQKMLTEAQEAGTLVVTDD